VLVMGVRCLRCGHSDAIGGNFCPECATPLPLTGDEDYFSAFGLARVLGLDPGRLKAEYFELSRRLHPDAHVSDAPEIQEATLRRSAFLNDGFHVLRDPLRRVHYLVTLEGRQAADGRTTTNASSFDLMEAIQDAQLEQDPAIRELRLREAETQVGAVKEAALRGLEDLARRWDGLGKPDGSLAPREALLDEMRERLDDIAYADRLLRAAEEVRAPEGSGKGGRNER
jgi:molecular chaperone HscB